MYNAVNELARIFTTAIDNAAPTTEPTIDTDNPTAEEIKDFFTWFANR